MAKTRDISIANLLLDTNNPRVEPSSAQREEMQKLLDDQKDGIRYLAEHIVENGISPIDLPLVMPSKTEKDKYIVLEGNRRLLALRILSNPHVLGDLNLPGALRAKLEDLASLFKENPIKELTCHVVDSRDQAQHWLELRHIGESRGAGVVGWSGVATARFRGEDPALQAIEFILRSGQLNAEDAALVGSMRFPITTFRRLLESRDVKDFLGVEVKEKKLLSGLPADELIKPLKRIALDLAHGDITVTDIKRKEHQKEYIAKFAAADRPDLRKAAAMRPVQDIPSTEFSGKGGGATRKRRNKAKDRAHVVPRTDRCPIKNAKANEIYYELRSLRIDSTPHACAVLLRVFLELTTDCYLRKVGIPLKVTSKSGHTNEKSLAVKTIEAIDHLVAGGAKKSDFQALRRGLNQSHSPLSAMLLNEYVHNEFTKPSARDLRDAWDQAQPFFQQAWEKVT